MYPAMTRFIMASSILLVTFLRCRSGFGTARWRARSFNRKFETWSNSMYTALSSMDAMVCRPHIYPRNGLKQSTPDSKSRKKRASNSISWMSTTGPAAKCEDGSQVIDLPISVESQAIVVARWLGKDQIDASTLTLLDSSGTGRPIQWTAPAGQWVV